MKHEIPRYASEAEALQAIAGIPELETERIVKQFHHKERVRVYTGIDIAKKYRSNNPRAIGRTYNEASAHFDLGRLGVNVPNVFCILHTDKECSLLLQYIHSEPLTALMIAADSSLPQHLVSVGRELGKLFENGFLHGDLTSYHILTNGTTYLFDLEKTKLFRGEDFHRLLVYEWRGFIDSTQGNRWKVPFSKEQEEMVLEGVLENLSGNQTRRVLETLVLTRSK